MCACGAFFKTAKVEKQQKRANNVPNKNIQSLEDPYENNITLIYNNKIKQNNF